MKRVICCSWYFAPTTTTVGVTWVFRMYLPDSKKFCNLLIRPQRQKRIDSKDKEEREMNEVFTPV